MIPIEGIKIPQPGMMPPPNTNAMRYPAPENATNNDNENNNVVINMNTNIQNENIYLH